MYDCLRTQVVELEEKLTARYASVRSIISDPRMLLGPSIRGLFETFQAGHGKSVRDALRRGFIVAWLHVNTTINGIALQFWEVVASEEDVASTKNDDDVDAASDTEAIEVLRLFFFIYAVVNKCSSFPFFTFLGVFVCHWYSRDVLLSLLLLLCVRHRRA